MNRIPAERPALSGTTEPSQLAAQDSARASSTAIRSAVAPQLQLATVRASPPQHPVGPQHPLRARSLLHQAVHAAGMIPPSLDLPSTHAAPPNFNPVLQRSSAVDNTAYLTLAGRQFNREAEAIRMQQRALHMPLNEIPGRRSSGGMRAHMQRYQHIAVTRHPPRILNDELQNTYALFAPPGAHVAELFGNDRDGKTGEYASMTSRWCEIDKEDGAQAFGAFLVKLRDTVNANNPDVRRLTMELVRQITDDPALREQVFAISVGATDTCEDRVSHTLLQMRAAALASTFRQTHFDGDHAALSVQRQFVRLELLHELAKVIVGETGNSKEHLETDLYLPMKHAQALNLNDMVPSMDMRWAMCARVTPERDATVVATIKRQENDEFVRRLSNADSWLDYVRRHNQPLYDASREQLIDLFDEPYRAELDARLNATGLNKNSNPAAWSDAERILGKVVSDEFTDRINQVLTRDFLDLRGALYLLDSVWPEEECVPKTSSA